MAIEQLAVRLLMDASQYKREAQAAATATGKIEQSASKTQTAQGKLDKQMQGLATTAKLAVAGVATAAVASFAKDSIRAATDLNESINAVNVVFGDAAEGVLAIGENSAESFGMAQSSFNEFAVRFSAFAKQIAERDGRSVIEVVDEMAGRVADFASVHNLSLEEAQRVAQSTMAGETEVFRRFGGDVSAAAVQAKLLEEGIIEVGEAASEQDKILGRYMLFMEQTADTAGDFKNTQDDLANATRTLSANMEDFKAAVGGLATGALADFVSTGNDLLTVFNGINDVLPDFEDGTGSLLTLFHDSLPFMGQFKDVVGFLADLFRDGAEAEAEATKAQREHLEVTEESIGAANRHRGSVDGLVDSFEELNDVKLDVPSYWEDSQTEIKNTKSRLQEYETALRRLTDPVFRAVDDQNRLADAYSNYQEVLDDAESTTRDVEDALFDIVEAQLDANSSAADLPESMFRTEQAFSDLADQLGLTEEELAIIIGRMDELDGTTARAMVEVSWSSRGDLNARDALVSGTGVKTETSIFRQHGGPVTAGSSYIVGEAGPELFIPSQSGTIVPNGQMTSTTGGVVAGPTYNVFTLAWGDFLRKAADAGVEIQRYGW